MLPAGVALSCSFQAGTGPWLCFHCHHGVWDLGLAGDCHAVWELELADCHGGWGAGGALGHCGGVMVILLIMAWRVLSTWVIC
jgi:hypothetical protein